MSARFHQLPATPEHVHWGYFDHSLEPVLTVSSGDLIAIETLTHHAGDAPDLLMDAGIERVFEEVQDRGPGPHLLTGPIALAGARPGDVLEVEILSAEPRLPHGSNLAGHWGALYEDFAKERVTIFELDLQAMLGRALFAHATATGETLYLTGQMPTGLDGELIAGGVVEQTDQTMRNLARVLELLGGGMPDVVQARAYLLHWDDYAKFNAAYERCFSERLPSRTCVGVNGLAAGALVEVDLVAWRAGGWAAR